MPGSLHIIDGDIAVDARGKIVEATGHLKVANLINYALSTSPYVTSLVNHTDSSSANEWAIRDAINKVINQLIRDQQEATGLPATEMIKGITTLNVTAVDKTSYSFFVGIETVAGSKFNLNLAKDF